MKRMDCRQKTSVAHMARMGACAMALGVVLALGAVPFPALSAAPAEAADVIYIPAPSEFETARPKTEIEVLADAYDKARATAISCDVKVGTNQLRVNALEARIPEQQARSDAAMREMYKMQRNRLGIMDALLGSRSLDDFLKQTEYIESVSRANLETINQLRDMRARLETARAKLDKAKAESDAAISMASEMLDSARAARAAKQSAGASADGAIGDGANWYQTEEEFVAEWAPRIDAYLAGSALDGQGMTFARASWRYCVDPRWSPAISNTESSKGAHCIRPHNAWGWGAADSDPYGRASQWGSWEEAIDTHVRGLAEGYGYTISKAAAEKYCSSPEDWYNNTRAQMEMI